MTDVQVYRFDGPFCVIEGFESLVHVLGKNRKRRVVKETEGLRPSVTVTSQVVQDWYVRPVPDGTGRSPKATLSSVTTSGRPTSGDPNEKP